MRTQELKKLLSEGVGVDQLTISISKDLDTMRQEFLADMTERRICNYCDEPFAVDEFTITHGDLAFCGDVCEKTWGEYEEWDNSHA